MSLECIIEVEILTEKPLTIYSNRKDNSAVKNLKRLKNSRRGVSTTTVIAAVILIIIVVVGAYYALVMVPAGPTAPIADFTFSPTSPLTGETVTFNASASTPDGGTISNYVWTFGDGASANETDPVTTHVYAAAGNFSVILNVTDSEGQSDTETKYILVVLAPQAPVASFTFTPAAPSVGEAVTFNASASTPDGGTISSYKWNFGDGNITTVTTSIIVHIYTLDANYTYTVTLNVTDTEAKSDTETKSVAVTITLMDTLIMGTTDSIESAVDPAQAYDYFGWEIIQNTGSGLVEIRPGSTSAGPEDYLPSLATSWNMTEDGLNWTFNLRQGVKFDDGITEFNATHVKYSFDRAMIGIASPDGPQVNLEYGAIIDNVEVVSKYQVRFNLKTPFGPFLGWMACQASYMVNPMYAPYNTTVWYTEGDARASSAMDLGPYKLTEWVRTAGKDDRMVLERNPYYWNATGGYPKTKKIIIEFYPDATALRLAIETGEIDIAYRHISPADIISLQQNPNLKVWAGPGQIQYLIFQEAIPPYNDSRVRRAITAALDRPTLCSTVFLNQTLPLYSMIPIGMMAHTEAFKKLGDANYTYTRSLLAELGYNETNKLPVELWYETSGHYPESEEQVLFNKASLEASGVITVTLKGADWPSYRLNRNNGVMPVFVYGWYPDYIDPDDYVFLYWAIWLNHHYADYGEHYTEMKAKYDAARTSSNSTERIRLYAELEDIAVQDCPMAPIWQGYGYAVTKLNVKGVYLDITQNWRNWFLYAPE